MLPMFGLRNSSPLVAIIAATSAATFASRAQADCAYTNPSSDQALVQRVFWDTDAHQTHYDQRDYIFFAENWPMPDRQDEFNTHFYSTLLIHHGVVGPDPPIRQNSSGAWEYDPQSLLVSNNFHRSWDGYAPLARDRWVRACQGISASNGGPLCGTDIFGGGPNFGHETYTTIEDSLGSGVWATNSAAWDLFRDPDSKITYSCPVLDHPWGFPVAASVIVHENWHSTGIGHKNGNGTFCNGGDGACDEYVWGKMNYTEQYYGLENLRHKNVGAYQIDAQFACDLVEEPGDWIPLQTLAVANETANAIAATSRYTNIGDSDQNPDTPTGLLPFTCGVPSGLLAVPVNGVNFCPGTTQLRCDVAPDCGTNRAGYVWLCRDGCCEEEIDLR